MNLYSRYTVYLVLVSRATCLIQHSGTYFDEAGLNQCPTLCDVAGTKPQNWTEYSTVANLMACIHSPKVLNYAIHTPIYDAQVQTSIRACSTFSSFASESLHDITPDEIGTGVDITTKPTVQPRGNGTAVSLDVQLIKASEKTQVSEFDTTTREVQNLLFKMSDLKSSDQFAQVTYGRTVVGVFVGGQLSKAGLAHTVVQQFIDYIRFNSSADTRTLAFQHCPKGGHAEFTFGVIADNSGGFSAFSTVQRALQSWAKSKCFEISMSSRSVLNSTMWIEASPSVPANETTPNANFNVTKHLQSHETGPITLRARASQAGICASYLVNQGDICFNIAAAHGLQVSDLESFNKNTWLWGGCDRLMANTRICIGPGDPPMAEPAPNAACGPTKPGTTRPSSGEEWADLNPCPLKSCCNVHGNCGTTEDFCIPKPEARRGIFKPYETPCMSNCGMDIVNNKIPPKNFMKVGYFEAWNMDRSCLTMDITQISPDFTHIHFAFADVTTDFNVDVSRVKTQFDKFVTLRKGGMKRILAIGGWAASTESNTYRIFRDGPKPENREKFARELAFFVKNYNLDGLDIDWEYPGAPDIPGIPAADPIDSKNYLELLKILRALLPDKSLSIAAPASFWYLKQFPIEEIGKIVDYIVYMTYDFHGQWDYGNQWVSPGCPSGNCLRSHVNLTETMNALSMVTKAGVPSHKIIVGVSSYGRSFKMTNPNCYGPVCTFVGPNSAAKKGRCTDTAGYISNAEIKEIIDSNPSARTFYDAKADSRVLIYDNTEWVAYMDDDIKKRRAELYRSLNFGGTTDWAIDLDTFHSPSGLFSELSMKLPKENKCKGENCLSKYVWQKDQYTFAERWEGLCASYWWNVATQNWKLTKRGKLDVNREPTVFTKEIGHYFHNEGSWQCQVIEQGLNDCVEQKCSDLIDRGPGTYLVSNSIRNLFDIFMKTHKAIDSIKADTALKKLDITLTFAPERKKEDDLAMGIWINFLNFALGSIAAPVFNNVFKGLNNARDSTYFAVTFLASSVKDKLLSQMPEGEQTKIEIEVANAIVQITDTWMGLMQNGSARIFDGSDASIDSITRLIVGGQLIEVPAEPSEITRARALRVAMALIIPAAWRIGNRDPVMIDTGVPCDKTLNPSDFPWVEKDMLRKAAICHRLNTQWLIVGTGPSDIKTKANCKGNTPKEMSLGVNLSKKCQHWKLLKLPGLEDGLDKLDESKWKVTALDLVNGAIFTQDEIGNRPDYNNLFGNPKLQPGQMWTAIQSGDMVMTPGVVAIPKCGYEEVVENWVRRSTEKNFQKWIGFPCNPH